MDERVTLRSHLDRSASQTPHGAALGDVIKAIAAAAIELAELIADGPLAGITGQDGGVNPDGDQQKDIDVAADADDAARLARYRRWRLSFPRRRRCRKPCVPRRRSASRSIRSTDRPISKTISRSAPSFRFARGATTFFPPSSSPARRSAPQASSSTARKPRSFSRSTRASISSFSTGARGNSC